MIFLAEQIFGLFVMVFGKCAEWTNSLVDAVGMGGIILAAFCIVITVSLLFMPMRGRMGATSFISDYKSYKNKSEKKD